MHKECPECGRRLGHKMDCSEGVMEDHGTSSERGIVGKAEHHATLIRAAITAGSAGRTFATSGSGRPGPMSEDYGRADRDYWNGEYADAPECELHGDTMYYEPESGEWECYDCADEREMLNDRDL